MASISSAFNELSISLLYQLYYHLFYLGKLELNDIYSVCQCVSPAVVKVALLMCKR